MEHINYKQLLVRIPKELHSEVKARAALKNISLALYVTRILACEMMKEKRYEDWRS